MGSAPRKRTNKEATDPTTNVSNKAIHTGIENSSDAIPMGFGTVHGGGSPGAFTSGSSAPTATKYTTRPTPRVRSQRQRGEGSLPVGKYRMTNNSGKISPSHAPLVNHSPSKNKVDG